MKDILKYLKFETEEQVTFQIFIDVILGSAELQNRLNDGFDAN